MRLFIEAELPQDVLEALAENSARLRASVKGRFVPPRNLHLTLAFLGEVESARIACIGDAIGETCPQCAPVEIALGGFGCFGRPQKATLFQSVDGPDNALEELAASLRASLAERGVDYDRKGFKPHITLMRNADLRSGTLPGAEPAGGRIERVNLVRSQLRPEGACYERIETFPLGV